MRLVLASLVVAAVVGSTQTAHANSCNLYQAQRWGEIREGCALTIFVKAGQDPQIPVIKRGQETLTPTIAQDQVPLKVTYEHYPTPTSCDLVPSYEIETFDRYVVSWPDLKGGDEVLVDNYSVPLTVPGPGDCGIVDPFFYCQDPIQSCDWDHDGDTDDTTDLGDDMAGCSAGGGNASWFLALGVVALITCCSRRSRTSSRR